MITGDGGFQMSVQELATLRQLGAQHVLIIVLVNGTAAAGSVAGPASGPSGSRLVFFACLRVPGMNRSLARKGWAGTRAVLKGQDRFF